MIGHLAGGVGGLALGHILGASLTRNNRALNPEMQAQVGNGAGALGYGLGALGGSALGALYGHSQHKGSDAAKVSPQHVYMEGGRKGALTGATIGSILAGPVGAAAGGGIGYLAGKGTSEASLERVRKHQRQEKKASLADAWGRDLARREAKEAGIGGMIGSFAKANPGALIGAGLGAAGGLANGLQKDQNGQRHIMSGLAQGAMGAAAGGMAGHAAQNIGSAVQGGASLGAAAKSYGTNMLGKAQAQLPGMVEKAKGLMGSAQGKLQGVLGKVPGMGPAAP
jgi:hypothetical protein